MQHPTRRGSRATATVAAALLAIAALSGCTPATPSEPTSTTAEGQQTVTYPEIRAAVQAAEPRVQRLGIRASKSGASNVLAVGVVLSGDEPVTTESLTAMLVAVRENLPSNTDQVNFLVRDDAENSHLVDISDAIDGLPDDVTVLYDGTMTIMRDDLDKL